MSPLLPALLFSAWWAELDRPHRLLDQNFGLGLYPDQLITPSTLERYISRSDKQHALFDAYYRPWAELMRRYYGDQGGSSTITADKDSFRVILDVQHFKPEEISVKIVDRSVVVEGKHEEKRDEHGTVSRHFVRKYYLPEHVNIDELTSNISTDGILTIYAPLKELPDKEERTIKINFTGKPALRDTLEKGEQQSSEKSTTAGPAIEEAITQNEKQTTATT